MRGHATDHPRPIARAARLALLACLALLALSAQGTAATPGAAKAAAQATLDAANRGVVQHPADARARWSLVAALADTADVLGDPIAAYRQAIGIIEVLDHEGQLSPSGKTTFVKLAYRLGAALAGAHDDPGAIAAYEKGIAFDQTLVAASPWDPGPRRDLAYGFQEIGYAKLRRDDRAGALSAFQDTMATYGTIAKDAGGDPQARLDYAKSIGFTCYANLLERHWGVALALADKAIAMAPDELWIRANRAEALMMLGRTDEARAIFLAYRGRIATDDMLWEPAVESDFAVFRKLGDTSPLIAEIEADFARPAAADAKR